MKTNAIISALCAVGIIGALCSKGEEQRSVVEPRPGALPVQKVVYWSNIPGMKWTWASITNKPTFATVATSGSYNDLNNKPTLATVATSGSYNDLSGKPTIPTVGTLNTTLTSAQATSANESLSGTIKLHKVAKTGTFSDMIGNNLLLGFEDKYVKIDNLGNIKYFNVFQGNDEYTLNLPRKNGYLAVLSDIPSTNGLASKSWVNTHQWAWSSISNKPSFATVATSGSYNDLSDKPSIPAAQVNADWNASSGVAQILNKPTLATVATSGSYNDLSNKPTIPSASDFVSISGDTMTGNLTIDPLDDSGPQPAIKVMWSNSMSSKYTMLRYNALVHGYLNGSAYTVNFQDKSGTMALNEDVVAIIPAWTRSSTVSYTAGDLVRYNSKLYKAKQNIAANAAWNANNWEEVTIASEFRSKADTSWVNNHKWDWGTQITNAPSFVPTTRKVNNHALSSDVTLSGLDISATVTSPVGGPDIVNNVQGHLSFLYQDAYNTEQTLNLKADRTEIPTVPTNVSAFNNDAGYVTASHTHSNLVNGSTEIVANANGTGSIVKQTYTTETRITGINFTDDFDAYWQASEHVMVHIYKDVAANQIVYVEGDNTVRHDLPLSLRRATPEEEEQHISWIQVGYSADQLMDCWFYATGGSGQFMSPNAGVSFPLTSGAYTSASTGAGYSFDHGTGSIWGGSIGEVEVPAGSVSETIATTAQIPIDYVSASTATNIAKQIIRNAVSGVNTNIQSAEDARAALTNLITILKNL